MSQIVQLDRVPVQEVSIMLDGRRYIITVRDCGNDTMAVSIVRDGVSIVNCRRAVAGFPLLPFRHLEDNSGNFIFSVIDDEIPHYSKFGITQELIYTTNAELEAIRNG